MMEYLVICDWFLSLGIMFPRFNHVVARISITFHFLLWWNICNIKFTMLSLFKCTISGISYPTPITSHSLSSHFPLLASCFQDTIHERYVPSPHLPLRDPSCQPLDWRFLGDRPCSAIFILCLLSADHSFLKPVFPLPSSCTSFPFSALLQFLYPKSLQSSPPGPSGFCPCFPLKSPR